MRRTAIVTTLSLLSLAPGATTAYAQGAAALVVDVSAVTTPPFKAFTEIPAGTTVTLGTGATLTFVHYETCRTVTVTGGKVTIGPSAYAVTDGKTSEARVPCPRSVKVRRGGETAGLVLRGGPPAVALSTRPAFILVGPRADDVASLRVLAGKGGDAAPVLELPLAGPRFTWPAEAPALAPDTEYELVFLFKDRAIPPARQSIISRVPTPNETAVALTLIRVD